MKKPLVLPGDTVRLRVDPTTCVLVVEIRYDESSDKWYYSLGGLYGVSETDLRMRYMRDEAGPMFGRRDWESSREH